MAHVTVCTPMYGGVCNGDFTNSLLKLKELLVQNYHTFNFIYICNESLIQRGRNTLTWMFLNETKDTHLLFIDADLGFNAADVLKMLAADKPIIGGIYPKKAINWSVVKKAIDKVPDESLDTFAGDFVVEFAEVPDRLHFDQPIEVRNIGTGFMLIKRHVFEDLAEQVGSYLGNGYTNERDKVVYNYFQVGVEDNILLSEDYFFCREYQKFGGKVYAAPWCNFEHNGNYRFRGSFVEHLKLSDGSFYK